MAKGKRTDGNGRDTSANVGFEAKLWAAADALRRSMDAAEYKHLTEKWAVFVLPDERSVANVVCLAVTLKAAFGQKRLQDVILLKAAASST